MITKKRRIVNVITMASQYGGWGIAIVIIIGLILLIAGVILYEQNKNTSSSASNTTWVLIGIGILFLLFGIGAGIVGYRSGGTKKEVIDTTYHRHHPDPYGVMPQAPMYPGYSGYPGYDTSVYAQAPGYAAATAPPVVGGPGYMPYPR